MDGFTPIYRLPQDGDTPLLFACQGETLLLGAEAELPTAAELEALGPPAEAIVFGRLDGQDCELRLWPGRSGIPIDLAQSDFRQLWGHWPPCRLAALARARGLAAWLARNRFCGICGQPMQTAANEPARLCPACGHKAYPRISPVCIGLVIKGDEILLARSPHFPPGIYSALAGFMEAGETAEDCLRREIREEAGVEIANIRWFGSQSWPYPDSLMMGFLADYAGGELVPQPGEIEDIGWYKLTDLPGLPHPASIAYQMIEALRPGR